MSIELHLLIAVKKISGHSELIYARLKSSVVSGILTPESVYSNGSQPMSPDPSRGQKTLSQGASMTIYLHVSYTAVGLNLPDVASPQYSSSECGDRQP